MLRPIIRMFCGLLVAAGIARAGEDAPVYRMKAWLDVSDRELSALGRQVLESGGTAWFHAEGDRTICHGASIRSVDAAAQAAGFAVDEIGRKLYLPARTQKIHVFLIDDEKQWEKLIQKHGFRPDGLAMQLGRELFVLTARADGDMARRVVHELVHVRMRELCADNLPLWLDEGTALYLGNEVEREFLEKQGEDADKSFSRGEVRAMSLKQAERQNAYPPDTYQARAFYATTEAVVAWTVQQLGEEVFPDVIRAACDGRDIDFLSLLSDRFGVTTEQSRKLHRMLDGMVTYRRASNDHGDK